MSDYDWESMRRYVWGYFKAYAEARLSTFRFYLIFCTILMAGIATIIGTNNKFFIIFLAILLSFLSFIYWKVDIRHKDLIDHSIEALEYIEKKIPLPNNDEEASVLRLFNSEAERSKSYLRFPKHIGVHSYFTYSTCVNIVFLVLGISGIVILIYEVLI